MEIPFQVMGGLWPRHQWGADLDGGPIASLRAAAQEVQRRDEDAEQSLGRKQRRTKMAKMAWHGGIWWIKMEISLGVHWT